MSVNVNLESYLQPYLASGETTIWTGKPSASSISLRSGLGCFFVFFILVPIFTSIALFMEPSSDFEKAWLIFLKFFALPLGTLFSLFYFTSGFLEESRQVYALTNRRLIILTGWKLDKVHSFFGNDIHSLETIKTLDYGHIKIWSKKDYKENGWKGALATEEFTFDTLRELSGYKDVAQLIHNTFKLDSPIKHRK